MKYARKENFSVVFMLISAEFDTVEYSLLLETFVFLSALVSMTPSSPACLLLPCQDYYFVCYPASPSFHDLLNTFVAEVLFLALFSIPLVFLHGHASLFELWCRHWWFPVSSFSSTHFLLSSRPKSVCLLDLSTTKSCSHLEPREVLTAHHFVAFVLVPLPTFSIWVCDIVVQYSGPRGWKCWLHINNKNNDSLSV